MANSTVIEAMVNGDLTELLTGRGGYAIHNPYLNTPTEPTIVFEGIKAAYGKNPQVMNSVAKEVLDLCDDPEYAWFAAYYIMDIIPDAALFGPDFDLQGFVTAALKKIRSHEDALRKLKKWAGAQDEDGCWGIVDRFVGQLKKYHESPNLKIVW